MSEDDYEGADEESEEWPRDKKVDEAKEVLAHFFESQRQQVFYLRQIAVRFEAEFFHWITGKALKELEEERKVVGESVAPRGWRGKPLRFHFSPKNRYWKRQAKRVAALVGQFSTSEFGKALGRHGEMMVDAAFPRAGMLPVARDAREYRGRVWIETQHDLDRIFERKGVGYGIEVKNTLDYIPRTELDTKVAMCGHLGLVPIFVVRMAPKSYVHQVNQVGGFTLVLKYQLYPFGHEDLAREVQRALGLPVDSPRALEDGTIQRLAKFLDRTGIRVNSSSNSQGDGSKRRK